MKRKGLIILTIGLAMMFAQAPAMAARYGLADRHGVWRDAAYWHSSHPDWVYRYHPEWVVDEQDWWVYDHRMHPEWFDYPFWQEYPIWTYGAYDQSHVWRYAGWWRARNPAWFYANHPRWAEPYPNWIRADHAGHPEWFNSPYWHDHPHDWNHPDEVYRNLRKAGYQKASYTQNRQSSPPYANSNKDYGSSYHPGSTGYSSEHPPAPAISTAFHPSVSAVSAAKKH